MLINVGEDEEEDEDFAKAVALSLQGDEQAPTSVIHSVVHLILI